MCMGIYRVGLIGIGGFGRVHARNILSLQKEGVLQCVAFADPDVKRSLDTYENLLEVGSKHYDSYTDLMEKHVDLDFLVIATPIHLHKTMAIQALEKGFHVLLEKPPVVTVQDLNELIEVQKRTQKKCVVNFQNTSGEAFRMLLDQIQKGVLGEITEVVGIGMWKRTNQYYERSPWAGKCLVEGEFVLDGTLSNPFAHLVHNCLIVAGQGEARNVEMKSIQAELYKGHDIDGEDTAAVRVKTKQETEIRIYTTLCNETGETPYILVKGSKGSAFWSYSNILKVNADQEKTYVYEEKDSAALTGNIYRNLLDVLSGGKEELYAPIDFCRPFVLLLNGAYESSRGTYKIPDQYLDIRPEGDTVATTLIHAKDIFDTAIQTGKLFSEIPVNWGIKTEPFNFQGYEHFPLSIKLTGGKN